MQEQVISPETAKLAKEKGFDIHVCWCGGYPECICIDHPPTQSLLQKWLRGRYKIHILVYWEFTQEEWIYKYNISDPTYRIGEKSFDGIESSNFYDTYEEALEQALLEALKLIK